MEAPAEQQQQPTSEEMEDIKIQQQVAHAMHDTLHLAGLGKFVETAKLAVAGMCTNYGTPGVTVEEAKQLCCVFYGQWLVLTGMKRELVRAHNKKVASTGEGNRVHMDDSKGFNISGEDVDKIINPFIEAHFKELEKSLGESFAGYGKLARSWIVFLCGEGEVAVRMLNLTRLYALLIHHYVLGGGNTKVRNKPNFVPPDATEEERFRLAGEEVRGDFVEEQTTLVKSMPKLLAACTSLSLHVMSFAASVQEPAFKQEWNTDAMLADVEERLRKMGVGEEKTGQE